MGIGEEAGLLAAEIEHDEPAARADAVELCVMVAICYGGGIGDEAVEIGEEDGGSGGMVTAFPGVLTGL